MDNVERIDGSKLEAAVREECPWDPRHHANYKYRMVLDLLKGMVGGQLVLGDLLDRISDDLWVDSCEDPDYDGYPEYGDYKPSKPCTVASSTEILKKLYPDGLLSSFMDSTNEAYASLRKSVDKSVYGLEAWMPEHGQVGTLFGLDRSTQPLRPMMIGTGPWPDDEDTGDPDDCPSTQPMGYMVPIPPPKPVVSPSVSLNDGMHCKKCNEKNEYADPNQPDGTYVCYGCR